MYVRAYHIKIWRRSLCNPYADKHIVVALTCRHRRPEHALCEVKRPVDEAAPSMRADVKLDPFRAP